MHAGPGEDVFLAVVCRSRAVYCVISISTRRLYKQQHVTQLLDIGLCGRPTDELTDLCNSPESQSYKLCCET